MFRISFCTLKPIPNQHHRGCKIPHQSNNKNQNFEPFVKLWFTRGFHTELWWIVNHNRWHRTQRWSPVILSIICIYVNQTLIVPIFCLMMIDQRSLILLMIITGIVVTWHQWDVFTLWIVHDATFVCYDWLEQRGGIQKYKCTR